MMDCHEVEFVTERDELQTGEFRLHRDGQQCQLALSLNGHVYNAEASDFFEALCEIRRQLEPQGWLPRCYGASRNVFPSGMARDMGAGLRAYRLQIGRPTVHDDLVAIFDTGPDVAPVTVDEQHVFYASWAAGLGSAGLPAASPSSHIEARLRRLRWYHRANSWAFVAVFPMVFSGALLGLITGSEVFPYVLEAGILIALVILLQTYLVYPRIKCPQCGGRFFLPNNAWAFFAKIRMFKTTCVHCGLEPKQRCSD